MIRSFVGFSLVIVSAVLLAGCNQGYTPPEGVIVTGRLVKGGQPLVVPNREVGLGSVDLQLIPLEEGAEPEGTLVEEDGSFRFEGAGAGIKPGKYKLAVYQRDQGPDSDALRGQFSEARTPIQVEIPADKVGGTHDLGTIELNDYAR